MYIEGALMSKSRNIALSPMLHETEFVSCIDNWSILHRTPSQYMGQPSQSMCTLAVIL